MTNQGAPGIGDPDDAVRRTDEARARAGDSAVRLMAAYGAFAGLGVLAALAPDRLLIEGMGPLNKLFAAFLLAAPIGLIALRLRLGFLVGRWRELVAAPPAAAKRWSLPPLGHPVLKVCAYAALYLLLPAMLALLTWKAAGRYPWGDVFLSVAIVCTLTQAAFLMPWPLHIRVSAILMASLVPFALLALYRTFDMGLFRPLDLAEEDFRGAHLAGALLFRADLRNANLAGATLAGVGLSGADLSGADLSDATFAGLSLSGARLVGANLAGVAFSKVKLSYADLKGVDLSKALLAKADIAYAELDGANLSGADLSGANLSGTDLNGADLEGANLAGASLGRAGLAEARLAGASLAGADLIGANLEGADLTGADLTGADLEMAHLPSATLARARLAGAKLAGADFAGADLTGADFAGAHRASTDIVRAKYGGVLSLAKACADPQNPPRNVPQGVKTPETWERCSGKP